MMLSLELAPALGQRYHFPLPGGEVAPEVLEMIARFAEELFFYPVPIWESRPTLIFLQKMMSFKKLHYLSVMK